MAMILWIKFRGFRLVNLSIKMKDCLQHLESLTYTTLDIADSSRTKQIHPLPARQDVESCFWPNTVSLQIVPVSKCPELPTWQFPLTWIILIPSWWPGGWNMEPCSDTPQVVLPRMQYGAIVLMEIWCTWTYKLRKSSLVVLVKCKLGGNNHWGQVLNPKASS